MQTLSEPEVAELKSAGVYLAGFTDAAIKRRTDLWDILVDGMALKGTFGMDILWRTCA
jgi:hypothetical protein